MYSITNTTVDATTKALDVAVKNNVAVTGPLTDAELRASPVPISGSISVSNASVGTSGSAIPTSSNLIAGSDGTNLRPVKTSSTGVVSVDGSAVTQPVSGPLTDAQLRATPVPISGSISATNPSVSATGSAIPSSGTLIAGSDGTNLKAVKVSATGVVSVDGSAVTQPVSGSVSVSNFPASQAVTGPITDTQIRATPLPISGTVTATGPLTDTQLRASAVPVSATQTGTWTVQPGNTANTTAWKVDGSAVTQPVSGTVSANQGGTWTVQPGNTANTTAWKVDGSAVTQPVSGTVSANQGGTWTVQPGNTANTTAWKVDGSAVTQPVSGTVTANTGTLPTLTKGTQGSTGFSTQDLKDAGRNQTNYYMAIQIVSTATDALLALTGYKSGALVAATTTPAVVTSGKTYRINSITLTYVTIVTTPGAVRFTLRANTGGVVAIGSPVVMNWTVGEPTGGAPVAGKFYTVTIPFPDGVEFAAGTGIGISQVGLNTVGTAAAVGYGIVSITGYEY